MPAATDLSSAIRRTNRFELKYLLPREAARAFQEELEAYLVPDPFGDGYGAYAVSSLY